MNELVGVEGGEHDHGKALDQMVPTGPD